MSDTYSKLFASIRTCLGMYRGERWVNFSNPSNGRLPAYPCCYVIYSRAARVVYVGQTVNLRKRMKEHLAERVMPHGFHIKARFGESFGDWLMREARLIARLRPSLNRRLA